MRVLLHEPIAPAGSALRASLEGHGCDVRTFASESDALESTRDQRPAVLVLDLDRGDRTRAVAERVKRDEALAGTTVIVVASGAAFDDPTVLHGIPADDFVRRNADPSELLARMRFRTEGAARTLRDASESRADLLEAIDALIERYGPRAGELLNLFHTDSDTGVHNDPSFAARLEEELRRATRYGLALSALRLDVDVGGDAAARARALPEVASVLLTESRDVDTIGRAGARGFVMLLPNSDDDAAAALGHRIGREIVERLVEHGIHAAPTIDCGVVTRASLADAGTAEFQRRAEGALDAARRLPAKSVRVWNGGDRSDDGS